MSEEIIDPHHRRRDLKLLAQAIRNGWAIPDELRERLPESLAEIALNEGKTKTGKRQAKKYDVRSRIGAARVLVQMDRANVTAKSAANCGEASNDPGDLHLHLHKHEAGQAAPKIEIVHVDDWYGQPAEIDDADIPPEEPFASTPGTP